MARDVEVPSDKVHIQITKVPTKLTMVLYMSFDKFLLPVESCDLSQADKSII